MSEKRSSSTESSDNLIGHSKKCRKNVQVQLNHPII